MAKLLDPFEQLEREFNWDNVTCIRPPSAFSSLVDVNESNQETMALNQEPADQAANLDTGEAPENSSKRYHQPLPSLNTIAFEKMRFCSCNQFHFFKL